MFPPRLDSGPPPRATWRTHELPAGHEEGVMSGEAVPCDPARQAQPEVR